MIDFQVYTALCPVADGHHDNIEARPNAKREAIMYLSAKTPLHWALRRVYSLPHVGQTK